MPCCASHFVTVISPTSFNELAHQSLSNFKIVSFSSWDEGYGILQKSISYLKATSSTLFKNIGTFPFPRDQRKTYVDKTQDDRRQGHLDQSTLFHYAYAADVVRKREQRVLSPPPSIISEITLVRVESEVVSLWVPPISSSTNLVPSTRFRTFRWLSSHCCRSMSNPYLA